MAEHDRVDAFDARLEAAVHAFADRAQTHVDAVAVAQRAVRRRWGVWTVLGRTVPVPVSIFVLLLLLIVALIGALAVGAPRGRNPAVLPGPLPVPTAIASLAPTTDGEGPEVVTGTDVIAPASMIVGGVEQRSGTLAVTSRMSDVRVTGLGTWQFETELSMPDGTGSIRGLFRLETGDGAWEGTCRGAAWGEMEGISATCWLAGSGAYAGQTYFRSFTWNPVYYWNGGGGAVEGAIYPGSPPVP